MYIYLYIIKRLMRTDYKRMRIIKHILYVGKTFIMKIKSNTTNKNLP